MALFTHNTGDSKNLALGFKDAKNTLNIKILHHFGAKKDKTIWYGEKTEAPSVFCVVLPLPSPNHKHIPAVIYQGKLQLKNEC